MTLLYEKWLNDKQKSFDPVKELAGGGRKENRVNLYQPRKTSHSVDKWIAFGAARRKNPGAAKFSMRWFNFLFFSHRLLMQLVYKSLFTIPPNRNHSIAKNNSRYLKNSCFGFEAIFGTEIKPHRRHDDEELYAVLTVVYGLAITGRRVSVLGGTTAALSRWSAYLKMLKQYCSISCWMKPIFLDTNWR